MDFLSLNNQVTTVGLKRQIGSVPTKFPIRFDTQQGIAHIDFRNTATNGFGGALISLTVAEVASSITRGYKTIVLDCGTGNKYLAELLSRDFQNRVCERGQIDPEDFRIIKVDHERLNETHTTIIFNT